MAQFMASTWEKSKGTGSPKGSTGPDRRWLVIAGAAAFAVILILGLWMAWGTQGMEIARDGEGASAPAEKTEASAGAATETQGGGGSATGEGGQAQAATAAPATQEPAASSTVTVHVDGAVASPGVYAVTVASPRVKDAIDAAGGLTAEADTTALNLASPLEDAMKVHVPRQGEAPVAAAAATTGTTATGTPTSGGGEGTGTALININTATAEELQALPGVGEATAKAIVQDREDHGPFSSPEDLMRVSGIGEKKFAKMKDGICV